jgi:hypothetical protein
LLRRCDFCDFVNSGRRAASYRGDDQDRVAVCDGRVQALRVSHVFIVDINIDEVPERVLLVVEMLTKFGVRRCQLIQRLARRRRFNFDLRSPSGKLP